jgi:hypothetical protein
VRGRHRILMIRHTGTMQDGMGSRRRRVNERSRTEVSRVDSTLAGLVPRERVS